jgi:hypothetical protein
MNVSLKIITYSITFLLVFNFVSVFSVSACKDIIAAGDATEGDYNLLMKVRDPSRPGLQVLCIVPEGYEYDYHHPWTGKEMSFTNKYKYIGVASENDVIPNIVKAGMVLSESGVSYADSDTNSRWANPTKNAWDDFDWIRYACEQAETEEEAVDLLTKDAVDKLHATGISENLFVVGPNKGYVVEADAYRYKIEEITNGVSLRHNYPKLLWKSQILKKLPIAKAFDTIVEKEVRKRGVVRLGSLYGVKITEIGEDYIAVSPVGMVHILRTNNIGTVTKINIGERESVGYFSVELKHISNNKATVRVTNIFKAWEEEMMEYINPSYGSITVKDMIKWSRLTKEDLEGLRSVCEKNVEFEAVTIYKIPKTNYDVLSMGWFAPNHASSSIYVPFHISNTEIFDPYENGAAAQLSLDLLNVYESDSLSTNFRKTEDVFLYEIDQIEEISKNLLNKNDDVSEFLTIIDTSMQKQAYLTEELWLDAVDKQEIQDIISNIWYNDYTSSLHKMRDAIIKLDETPRSKSYVDKIKEISLNIVESRIYAAKSIGKDIETIEEKYIDGKTLINDKNYNSGFSKLINAYDEADSLINGRETQEEAIIVTISSKVDILFVYLAVLLIVALIVFLIIIKKLLF